MAIVHWWTTRLCKSFPLHLFLSDLHCMFQIITGFPARTASLTPAMIVKLGYFFKLYWICEIIKSASYTNVALVKIWKNVNSGWAPKCIYPQIRFPPHHLLLHWKLVQWFETSLEQRGMQQESRNFQDSLSLLETGKLMKHLLFQEDQ